MAFKYGYGIIPAAHIPARNIIKTDQFSKFNNNTIDSLILRYSLKLIISLDEKMLLVLLSK